MSYNKDIGKFTIQSLKALGIVIILYPVFILLIGSVLPSKMVSNIVTKSGGAGLLDYKLYELKNVRDIDVLFLGSSHTYRSFDNRIFEFYGYKSFNLGSSAQSHKQTNYLLKKYLHQLSPKKVIYETYPGSFSTEGLESTLDIISSVDVLDQELVKMASQHKSIKILNTLVYKSLVSMFRKNDRLTENKYDKYISGGFVERKNGQFKGNISAVSSKKIHLNDDQVKFFEDNLQLIKEYTDDVTLIETPILKSHYETVENRIEINQYLRKHGFTHIIMNEEMELDTSYFYDKSHLNQKGANYFSTWICENILK